MQYFGRLYDYNNKKAGIILNTEVIYLSDVYGG